MGNETVLAMTHSKYLQRDSTLFRPEDEASVRPLPEDISTFHVLVRLVSGVEQEK